MDATNEAVSGVASNSDTITREKTVLILGRNTK